MKATITPASCAAEQRGGAGEVADGLMFKAQIADDIDHAGDGGK
jgi:hypothetical protein